MFTYTWFGFLIVFIIGLFFSGSIVSKKFPKSVRHILIIGFIVHAIGAIVRYAVLYGYYDGGDAGHYYRFGLKYAEMIWNLDFFSMFDPLHMRFHKWWGTQMTMWISGFVLALIGPSKIGGFLFFGILAYISLALFGKVFEKNFPDANWKNYLAWLFFWPSLWFWPSSMGKDALILLGTGLVVYGYAKSPTRIKWFALIFGLTLAAFIRPQVAVILIVGVVIAHWIAPSRRWNTTHYLQGFLILIALVLVMRYGFSNIGIDPFDVEDFRGYLEFKADRSSQGGSAIATPAISLMGIPIAIVNILFRPFLWEAANPLSLCAALEMIVFWWMVFNRRKSVIAVAREWRSSKLLRLAVPLTLLYAIALGLAAGNLGIIARQRIHVMPLLLIFLAAQPVLQKREVTRGRQITLQPQPLSASPK